MTTKNLNIYENRGAKNYLNIIFMLKMTSEQSSKTYQNGTKAKIKAVLNMKQRKGVQVIGKINKYKI